MSELTPLHDILPALLAGAFVASDHDPYRPIYPPALQACTVEVWPPRGSQLGQLLMMLRPSGAAEYLIAHIERTLTPQMSQTLRTMPYREFLGTQYWWLVRGILLTQRGLRCEDCHLYGFLDVHHLRYDHRGTEVFYLDDLLVCCRGCHLKRHGEPDAGQ